MRETIFGFLQLRWLDRDRINAYSVILIVASLPSFFWFHAQATGETGSDFLAFWSAGKLVLSGMAGHVYDPDAISAIQAGTGSRNTFAFVNPPPFLFVVAPLGWLSYPVAWVCWIAATYAFWLAATRRLDRRATRPVAAFPGALVAAWHAQTGLLTSGIQALAASTLEKRPFLAGIFIGTLIVKPHLAVLFPVALIASRNWRAIAGATAAVIGLMLAAWAAFGTQTILGYPRSWEVSRILLATGGDDFFLRQATPYAALRVLSSQQVAIAGQVFATGAAMAITWIAWKREIPVSAKLAVLFAATPLATPYLFNYDLPFLVMPVLWLAGNAGGAGWERPVALGFYLAPLVCRALAFPLGMNLTPVMAMLLLWCILRYAGLSRFSDPG